MICAMFITIPSISCIITATQLLPENFHSFVLLDRAPLESMSRLHQGELSYTSKHWALRKQSVPFGSLGSTQLSPRQVLCPRLTFFLSVSIRVPHSCAYSRSNNSLCKICITQLLPPLGNCMSHFQQFFLGPWSSSQGDNEDMCQS